MSLLCLLATQPELQAGMADPAGWLSPTEQARLAGFSTEPRRQGFLAGRWLARLAVRRWQGADALPVLTVAGSGACHVDGAAGRVFVSISHSGEQLACAVAGQPVGIDVERMERPRDHLALARSVHGPAQQAALAALPEHERGPAFLALWTLKEAWLKARERGLDVAEMRRLAFDDDPQGDVAVANAPGLVLALAADPALPARIEGEPHLDWRRCRTRRLPAG